MGDTSPQMGSLCLAALKHRAGDKHPGMGLKLEPSPYRITAQGTSGRESSVSGEHSVISMEGERKTQSTVTISGELPGPSQNLALCHHIA